MYLLPYRTMSALTIPTSLSRFIKLGREAITLPSLVSFVSLVRSYYALRVNKVILSSVFLAIYRVDNRLASIIKY